MTDEDAIIRQIVREEFFAFLCAVFNHLHPANHIAYAWHTEAMCYALYKVAIGQTKRLLITVPPRYGKSLCTSVGFPAWLLGRDPTLKILVTSYGGELATKHSQDFRKTVTSDWYRRVFPHTQLEIGGNRADEQTTTRQGGRKAVSLGGAVTGFGADLIIVDDLMKADDARSPTERLRVREHYEQTLLSRLNNQTDGRIIVIAQRLHEDDLPGFLLTTGQFEHLNLPAIAQRDEIIALGPHQKQQRRKGEALWPERQTLGAVEALRISMGNFAFAAQYLQDPTPAGGNRLRWEWFGTHDLVDAPRSDWQYLVQCWDTAQTGEPTSDFSVGMTWALRSGKWHLLDLVRKRLDFPDLKNRVLFEAKRWKADIVLIESAGAGLSLLQQFRQERNPGRFHGVSVTRSKDERVEAETARLQIGNYLVPLEAPWIDTLRQELMAFPNGRYDDQVDSLIHFVHWSATLRGKDLIAERHPTTGRKLRNSRPQFTHRRMVRMIGSGP